MPAEVSANAQPIKHKWHTPAKMEAAQHLQAEQAAAAAEQEAHEANQHLANIQASHLYDVDLPTPHSDAVPPSLNPRQHTSWANMATLLAEGHTGGGGGDTGNTCDVAHDADKGADAGECCDSELGSYPGQVMQCQGS